MDKQEETQDKELSLEDLEEVSGGVGAPKVGDKDLGSGPNLISPAYTLGAVD